MNNFSLRPTQHFWWKMFQFWSNIKPIEKKDSTCTMARVEICWLTRFMFQFWWARHKETKRQCHKIVNRIFAQVWLKNQGKVFAAQNESLHKKMLVYFLQSMHQKAVLSSYTWKQNIYYINYSICTFSRLWHSAMHIFTFMAPACTTVRVEKKNSACTNGARWSMLTNEIHVPILVCASQRNKKTRV